MVITAQALKDLFGTIALMALLSVAYGTVSRLFGRPWLGRAALGGLFGGAALLAMWDHLLLAPGILVDMRLLPLVLAGAFLGPQGALAAVAMAVLARIGMGGTGMGAGVAGALAAGLAGLLWARLTARQARRGLRSMALLAGLGALPLLAALLLPAPHRWTFVTAVWPVLMPLQVLGLLIVGGLLERERGFVVAERRLARAASRDALTGLLNRRGFEAAAREALGLPPAPEDRLRRRAAAPPAPAGPPGPGALLLLDLDHFKQVNDAHGHGAGDLVLRAVAGRLRRSLRPGDLLGRWGGEEVVALLPGASRAEAEAVAERLRHSVGGRPVALPGGRLVRLTVSVGVAWDEGTGAPDLGRLTARADLALYAAKREGRDRVRFDDAAPSEAGGAAGAAPEAPPAPPAARRRGRALRGAVPA